MAPCLPWRINCTKSVGLTPSLFVYVRYHLSNQKRRQRLMGVWKSLVNFPVSKKALLKAASNKVVPIHLVIGKEDKIIDWNRIQDVLHKWPSPKRLHYLNAGHQLITENTAKLILENR